MNPHEAYDIHVTAPTAIMTGRGRWRATACFLFDVCDPLAITLCIDPCSFGLEPIQWTFSRELLVGSLAYPREVCGEGDVRITTMPHAGRVIIELASETGDEFVPFMVELQAVRNTLTAAEELSPLFAEGVIDVDGLLAEILGSDAC